MTQLLLALTAFFVVKAHATLDLAAPLQSIRKFNQDCSDLLHSVWSRHREALTIDFADSTIGGEQGQAEFARQMEIQFQVEITLYGQWGRMSSEDPPLVPRVAMISAFSRVVRRAAGQPVLFVRLDHFSPENAFQHGIPPRQGTKNFILHRILSEPEVFALTKWYDKGQELSKDQIISRFEPWYPELRNF